MVWLQRNSQEECPGNPKGTGAAQDKGKQPQAVPGEVQAAFWENSFMERIVQVPQAAQGTAGVPIPACLSGVEVAFGSGDSRNLEGFSSLNSSVILFFPQQNKKKLHQNGILVCVMPCISWAEE